jgi:RNA polymerase sigma-70 factor (ECF subfamily)
VSEPLAIVPATACAVPPFRDVYEHNAPFVWRVLRRLGVQQNDLEDVCQEVFLIVHRKLPEFEHRSALRTWIYGIALRCAADHRKRAFRTREISGDVEGEAIDAAQHDSIAYQQARQILDRILERLDEDKRAVFVLYELEELPMDEVAEIIGCPLQTAYSRLHVARAAVETATQRLRNKEVRS